MQDTNPPKKPKNFFKERFSRFIPAIFLKKNLPIIIAILLFGISILLGVWNIHSYQIFTIDGEDISENISKDIKKYIEENIIGKNFFSIYSRNTEGDMQNSLVYVKYARIEKKLPNKVIIYVDLYNEKYITQTKSNSCYLLSEEGIVLENLCQEEDSTDCCSNTVKERNKPFLRMSDIDVVNYQNNRRKLLVMEDISKFLGLVRKFGYTPKEISLINNIVRIKDDEGREVVFSVAEDITSQLQKYYVVMGKIRQDEINWVYVDFRFERPVMKIR